MFTNPHPLTHFLLFLALFFFSSHANNISANTNTNTNVKPHAIAIKSDKYTYIKKNKDYTRNELRKLKRWLTLFSFISSIALDAPLDGIQCISRRNSSRNRFQSCGSTKLNSAREHHVPSKTTTTKTTTTTRHWVCLSRTVDLMLAYFLWWFAVMAIFCIFYFYILITEIKINYIKFKMRIK